VSLKTPKILFSASKRKYTAAGGDDQVLWGGIHEWRKSGTERYTLLLKQTQFCMSFTAPWRRNGSFQRTQSIQFLNWSLFRSSPAVMNFRWRLKEYCRKNKRHRWDICKEFSVWHFATKSTGPKSVKPRMSSHFSKSRDPRYVSSATCPECPRKDWRTKSFGLRSTPTGMRPKLCLRTRWRIYISGLYLVLSWCGASRTIWDCCWSRGIPGALWGFSPGDPPQTKSGHENE